MRVPLDALVRRVASAHRTPVVLDPEFRSACEVLLSLVMLTQGLVRPAQAHMERTHERLGARITLPTFESDEVPAKRLSGVVFEMCDIVSRHSRVIVIERGIPCQREHPAGGVEVAYELSLGSCDTQLSGAAVEFQ